jgi:prepilin-type N-terminal cleavage/methylation domain-containing protein
MRHQNGFTLMESLAVLAIIGALAMVAVPSFATYRRHASLLAEAEQMRSIFRAARSRAITRNAHAGVRFAARGSDWTFALYDDGDGDGIRSDDIAKGIDRCFAAPSVLMPQFHIATVALLPGAIRDPDGDPLPPTASAVQFGTSSTCSFSPTGSGTPGTAYITNKDGEIYAIRVYGASGKVRVLRYNALKKKWGNA